MQEIIKIENLSKSFKELTAVNNLNLEIFNGECFALLGPNGAGKTTVIKILACLLNPTSGTAYINNLDVTKQENEVKKLISVCPQENAIAKNLTALENLEMVAKICNVKKEEAKIIAENFGLLKHPKMLSKNLSGGNKRRLSIAMALISKPKILFLDEPTLGLDVEARFELWDLIASLKGRTTIILTTHYLEEADKLADRIGIIKDGNLIALSSPEGLRNSYTKKGEEKLSIDEIYLRIIRGDK